MQTASTMSLSTRSKASEKAFEITVFAMLGALMFASKIIMEVVPNIHLLGMFTVVFTVVFRKKALIPIYIFVLMLGIYCGFSPWWLPYLYIWTILWAVVMLIPKNLSPTAAKIVYPIICALHGFAFGILYAPAQAIIFGLDFSGMIAWIVSGLPWDMVHGLGNLAAGLLIYPLSQLLKKLIAKR